MVKKIVAGAGLVGVLFLSYVATRDAHFHYEKSGVIYAKSEAIYPYISRLKLGTEWSPFEKDPNTKRSFGGADGQPGAFEDFESKQSGSGRVEIASVVVNQKVELRLHMTKPITSENHVVYTLTPEGGATRFTWMMEGDGGYLGKLIGTFIDCEKMIGGMFESGIADLKRIVESKSDLSKSGSKTPATEGDHR